MVTIQQNKGLKELNTFAINCIAKHYCQVENSTELISLLSDQTYSNMPRIILGGGSNILFQNNFDGLVIKNNIKGITTLEKTDTMVRLEVNAGELWDDLINYAVDNFYYGIENLTAIPGTVGAAPIQNIGAYGVEIKDCIEEVIGLDTDKMEIVRFNNKECLFGYRQSIFKNQLKNKFIVTSIIIKLSRVKKFILGYRALQDALGNKQSEHLSLKEVSNVIKSIRQFKLPDVKELGNSGSFFKNPEVNRTRYNAIKTQFPNVSAYKTEENTYKIHAGWLIEQCGYKGKKVGNVGCYNRQALVIVNYGGATGKEVLDFAVKIQKAVERKFKILLEPEVNII